jgi:hypothetical protein
MLRDHYAAIWIEDKDQKTVKTIALWYNKGRWLPDLRDWYRKNGSSLSARPQHFCIYNKLYTFLLENTL